MLDDSAIVALLRPQTGIHHRLGRGEGHDGEEDEELERDDGA